MHRRLRFAVAFLAGLVCPCVFAAVASSEEQIRALFEVMHMQETLGQMNTQMAGLMQKKLPCVPASYWQNYIDGDGAKTVMERMLPVFQRHFSAEEVDGLLKFYSSPLGQKVLADMPAVMAEAMAVGQQWGQERTRTMLGELKQKGTLDAQGRCPATGETGTSKPASTSHGKKTHRTSTHRKPVKSTAKPTGAASAAKPASPP